MDLVSPTEGPPNEMNQKPSFRKPSSDATNRKYRRHSPGGELDSSSSDACSPKRVRNPDNPMDNQAKIERHRKGDAREEQCKGNDRESHRDSRRHHSGRDSDYFRQYDRRLHSNFHDSRRNDDYRRANSYTDEESRKYERSNQSGRDSRGGKHTDFPRYDGSSDKSREHSGSWDKCTKGRYEDVSVRTDREGELAAQEYQRHNERDPASGGRLRNSGRSDVKTVERDRYRDKRARDERRDPHKSVYGDGQYIREDLRDHKKDSAIDRDHGVIRLKERHKRGNDEEGDNVEDLAPKRKYFDRESEKHKDKHQKEAENEMQNDSRNLSMCQSKVGEDDTENQDSSARRHKHGFSESSDSQPKTSKFTSAPISSTSDSAGASQNVDAAKFAALRAAELVNKNLSGGAYLSTDQKKKLLWGNKKTSAPEESTNPWGSQVFSDQARQEKFNKLMGVKGEANQEKRPDHKDVEQQKDLDMDLEKQYTAGLRRRDGRTVGLGL